MIKVNISKQTLSLYDDQQQLVAQYPVSTSLYGAGNREGSFQTPLGHHQVCEKYGDGMAEDEVFIGRVAQGRLAELKQQAVSLPDDIITARILRLAGVEPGVNQGGEVDSYKRYIYIHGTADEATISMPVSHGCIRMRNQDIIELYDKVPLLHDVVIEA